MAGNEEYDEEMEAERELADSAMWKVIQKNTFTRWANEHLKQTKFQIADMEKDFSDGLKLIALIESLSGKKFAKFNKKPSFRTQKFENVTMSLKFLEDKEGIKLVNIDSSDIVDQKLKLIMGLIWTLILHYSITMPTWEDEGGFGKDMTPKQRLLAWIQNKIPEKNITNFTSDWNDGTAIAALVDAVAPGLIPDWANLLPTNKVQNAKNAMDLAEKFLDVPQVIKPEEMCNPKVDELSMMTYLSRFPSAKIKPGAPVQQKPNAQRIRAYGPGIEPVGNVVGAPARFIVETANAGTGELEVVVLDPKGKPEKVELLPNNDRTVSYNCVYTPNSEGPYTVTIKYAGQPSTKQPYLVNVAAKAQTGDPSKVIAQGPGVEKSGVLVNRKTYFDVITKGAGIGVVDVGVFDPQGKPLKATVTKKSDDVWYVEYTAEVPGLHSVNVNFAGKPIPKSPYPVGVGGEGGPPVDASRLPGKPISCSPRDAAANSLATPLKAVPGSTAPVAEQPQAQLKPVPGKAPVPGEEPQAAGQGPPAAAKPIPKDQIPIDAKKCWASGRGIQPKGVRLGDLADFKIHTENAGNAEPRAMVMGPGGTPVQCTLKKLDDDTYEAVYKPTKPGLHIVNVTFAGQQIPKSPFKVDVGPLKTSKVVAFGPGLESGVVNQPAKFTVQPNGEGPIGFKIEGPSQAKIDVTKNPQQTEMYVSYLPTVPGEYAIRILSNNDDIPKSPYIADIRPVGEAPVAFKPAPAAQAAPLPPGVDPTKVTAFGPGLEKEGNVVNKWAEFTVDATKAGQAPLVVTVTDAENKNVDVKVVDNKNLTFSCKYLPLKAVTHTVTIFYAGHQIPKSPYLVNVKDAGVGAGKVKVYGPAIEKPVQAKILTYYMIDCKEAGPGEPQVTLTNDKGQPVNFQKKDLRDRTYRVEFTAMTSGVYTTHVTFSNQPVPRSPFPINVLGGPDASKVKVYGPALDGPVNVNELSYFIVDCKEAGPGEPRVILMGEKVGSVPIKLVDQNDRTYKVEFTAPVAGLYNANVQFASSPVPKSPFRITAQAAIDIRQVFVKDLPEFVPVNKEVPFEVVTAGAGPGKVKVVITSPTGKSVPVRMDEKPGVATTVKFIPVEPGPYKVEVFFAEQPVAKSPFKVTAEAANPFNVKVYGPAIDKPVFVNEVTYFIVDHKEAGPGEPQVKLVDEKGAPIPFNMLDQKDKTHRVEFTPVTPGSSTATVTFAGQAVPKSPFKITVQTRTDTSKVKVYGPALEKPVPIRYLTYFIIDCKEAGPGIPDFNLATEDGKPVQTKFTDNKDGTFTVEFTPEFFNPIIAYVNFLGQAAPNSPYKIIIYIDVSKVKVYGPAVEGPVTPKVPTHFIIDCKEVGPGEPKVALVDDNGTKVPFTLNDQKDGTFKVEFVPESVPLTANVLFADQPVPESPFRISVLGGLNDPSKVKLSGPAFEGPVAPREPTYFNIDCKEAGPGEPKVLLTDDNKVPVPFTLKDNKDGTYKTELTPQSTVPITTEVFFAGQPVPQSPFKIVISFASKVKVYGPAVEKPVPQKVSTYFIVDCKLAGPGQPTVLLVDENGNPKPFQQTDNKDGTFKVEFVPETPSPLLAQVTFANEPVPKSPFLINVVGGPANPNAVKVYGPALEEPVFEKVPTYFVVDCKEAGPGEPVVDLKSEDGTPIKPTIVDNKDQTYKVDFVPVGQKPIFAQVLFANQPVPKSPFKINVRPGTVDASKVKLSGPAVEGPVKSNLPTYFNIDAKEAGPAKPEVALATEDNKPVKATVQDNKDGTYKVDFVPREVKPIIAQVKLANQNVPKSPFKVTVEAGPAVDPTKVKLYGPATEGPVKCCQPTYFVVDAKEAGPGEPDIILATEDGTPVKPQVTDNKDGTYKVDFVPVVVQPITAQVKFADQQVPKSPFKIPVEPGVTDASKVKLTGPAVEGPVKCCEPTHFVVDAKEAGPGKPEVKVVDDKGTPVPVKVKDNNDCTHVVEFVPEAVVPLTANVTFCDKPVPQSPLKINVQPSTGRKPDASKVKLSGPAVEGPVKCCEPTHFVVDTREAGPGTPEIALTFENGSPLKPVITDNKNGTYQVDFVPNMVQPITARVLFGCEHVPKSPLKIPVEATSQCDPSKVHLYGPATEGPVKASQPTYFVIDAKEAGPGQPEVTLTPENDSPIKPKVTDNHDGTYKAEFVPVVVKPITAHVKYAGSQVPKSPFKIPVEPGVTDVSKVKLSGPAVEGPVKSQEPTYFVVDAKEAGPGQPTVALTADNGAPVPVKLTDNNDGTFVAAFTPEAVIPITADVKYANQPVPKSPFKIPVEQGTGKQPDASKVKLHGPAVEGPVKSNEPTYFVVDAKEAGPGHPEVALFPENAAPLKPVITDNKDGTFKVDFVPLAPRPIVGQVKFAEKPVPKSPFKIQVEPTKPTDASKVKVFGPAVEGPVKSNKPTYFVVDAKEAGPGHPEVDLTVDDGTLIKPKVTDNKDGTYNVDFVPVVVKPITAQVKFAGSQVPKSPFKIPVEPGVNDASKVKLSGPAVEGPVKCQEPTYFVVDAKEAGPEKPEVKLTAANGAPVPVKVKDNHDGTYLADFVPEAVVPISAEVKYAGQQVPKSPLQIPVEPGTGKKPDASKVKLYGPAVEGPVKSNKPTYFVVDAKEAGPGLPEVALLPESGAPLKPTVTDNKDGTYKVDFVPVHVQPITAHVKFADKEVPKSPFKIPVEPSTESDASKVKLYGPATEGPVKSNQPTYFIVDAKEAGPGYPEVVISFDDGCLVTPTVTDNKDGTYTVEFVPVSVRPLTVDVKYAGKQVPKSPFKVTVVAGGVNPSKVKLSGPAVEGPVKAQEPTYFVIDAKEAGPDQPEVKLTPQGGAPLPVHLLDNHDGTYVADFVPQAVVPITAEVKYAGQQVPRSPLQIPVEPSTGKKPDASKVKLYGPAVEGPVKSNKPTYFIVDTKEAGPGGHPVVELVVERGAPLKPTVTDNKDGTFKVDFVPLIPQPIIGQVKFAGQQVPKSPFRIPVELTPGGDASKVKLSGPAVEGPVKSNQPTFFIVDAKEAGPGYPEVVLTTDSGTPVKPNITEVANGVYKTEFVPTAVQPITGQVKFAGQQVPKSPFRVPVEPGTGPDVSKVKVYGPAVEHPVKSQEPTYFVVDTKESGPGLVDVNLKDSDNKETKPHIHDNHDGTYKVDFVPDKPLEATVLLNNQPVPKSPFKVNVQPSPFDTSSQPLQFTTLPVSPGQAPDANKVKVYGPAVEQLVSSGQPTYFVVDTKESGPGIVDVLLKDSDNKLSKPNVQDNHDGTYKVDFVPDKPLEATVLLNNQPVPKSPFKVNVQPSPFDTSSQPSQFTTLPVSPGQTPDVNKVKVYGPAVEQPVSSSQPTYFVVDTKESGPGLVDILLKDSDNKLSKPHVQDNHDGTYKVDFVPDKPLEATVLLNNQPVPKSPFKVNVQPSPFDASSQPSQFFPGQTPDVNKVKVYGPAVEQPVSSDQPTYFVVDTKESGPGLVDVLLKDSDNNLSKPHVQDNHDGTYKVDFVPDKPLEATVLLNNQPVPKSPFKVNVQPSSFDTFSQPLQFTGSPIHPGETPTGAQGQPGQGARPGQAPDVTKVKVYGPAVEHPVSSGQPTYFVVDTRESGPGPVNINFTCEGNVRITPQIIDNKDGTYRTEFTPEGTGTLTANVEFDGKPVPKNPFNITVFGSGGPDKVKVYGPAVESPVAPNVPTHFVVDTKEAGPEKPHVELVTDSGKRVEPVITDDLAGTYNVEFTPPNEPVTARILYANKPVPRSPFRIQPHPENIPAADTPSSFQFVPVAGAPQGQPDVDRVRTYGPAVEQPVEVAKPTHFIIDSRDAGFVPEPVVNVVKQDGSPVPLRKTDNKDGTYRVDFTPQDVGVLLSHVVVAGRPVPGSPFKTSVEPKTSSPAKVSGVPKAITVGKPEPINIQLAGPKKGPATVELVGPHGNTVSSPVYDKPDGYLGQVTAVEPGPHKIVVKVANEPVEGSPFNVEAVPASLGFVPSNVVDASKVKVFGPGLHGGTTNKPCDFTIDTSAAGPGNLGLTIDGPTEAKIECFDKGNGIFDVRYLPNEPGEYTINITFDDKPVPHSPFKAQINPEILVDVSRVRTYGPGVEPHGVYLDSVTEFTVDTKTVQPKGVGNVKVILTNPSGTLTEAIVKKNDDDTYTCLYTPFEEGPTKIDVTYDGLKVPGSPFTTNVTPGCDPSKVKVYGPGIERGEPNQPARFIINTRGAGVGGVGLSVVGPTEPQVDCVDNQDGTLSVEYLPETPGEYEIGVTFADQPVPGSPFLVPIGEPVKPFYPDRVKCFGPGLNPQGVKQGQKAVFSVVTNQAGEAPLEVIVNDLNTGTKLPVKVNKNPSGTYDVEYEPHNEGPIRIDVLYGGRPVPGSPFNTVSKPFVDLSKVTLTGEGVKPQVPASIPTTFTVDTRAAAPTPLPVDVDVKTPQGKVVKPMVVPIAPGLTQVTYVPEDAGPYQIHVKVANQEIPNSPVKVNAVPTGNPEKVVLPDSIPSSVAPNQTFTFKVQKPSTAGPGSVICKVTKAGQPGFPATEIPATVQDNHDGTVSVSYPVPDEGVLIVETKFGGVLVPRGRFTQKVGKPGEPALTPLIPMRISTGEVVPQTPVQPVSPLTPTLRQVDISSIPVGPDMSQVQAYVIKPSGENVPVQIVPTEQGTIRIVYSPTEPGPHTLKVLYNGQPVPGDPFTFYVHAPIPGQVTAFGPGLISGAVNQPCVFTVVTKNAGKGGLSLAIEGPSKAEIKCKDNKDGSATITYIPTSPGDYKIVVKHAGQPIPGAPFVAKITGEDRSVFTRTVTTTEQSTVTRQSHVTVGSTRHLSIQVTESDLSNLSALIRSPSGVEEPCGLKRQPSGQLGISFTPKESGEHLVIVFRNGQPIPGSPFRVFIQATEVGDANKVKIYGDNLTQGQANEVNSFIINTKEAGVAGLSISVQGPGKVDIKCTELEDGTTKVTYKPTEPGVYHVTIKYGDKPVPGSPFTINVGGVPSGRVRERIVRQQQAATMTSVGTTCELNITMPGININEIEGFVTSPSGQIERCQIVDLGNNKFRISFSPKESGIHYVSLKHKGFHIPGSPFQFTVGPIVGGGPEKVRAIGPGLVRGAANHPCCFTVITREAGAGSLSLGVEGPSKAIIDFQDRKDGTSDVSYVCSEPGEYLVSVKFNGQHIPDSPFKVYISGTGGDINKLLVQNLQQQGVPVNIQTQFLVEFNGAQGKLDAKVVAPSGQESEATVQEIRPGHFSIVFLPKESGVHYVHLLLNGQHIPGSPYPVQVGVVNADPSRVRAYGEGLHHGQSGQPCKFIVNTTESGPGALSVGISGPSKVELQTREIDEGYEFTYTPLAPGPYLITIKYAGNTHIPGSPFKAIIEGQGTPAAFDEQSRIIVETVTKTTTSSITSHQHGELVCDVSKVMASGPGLRETTVNQDSTFTVDGSQAGYNVLHVGVAGPHIPVDKIFVTHMGDLRYSVKYQVSQPGRYLVYVKWGEQHIPGSPFTVVAK